MLNRLGAVDQHPRPIAVAQFDDLLHRRHRAERVRNLGRGNQLRPRPQQILEFRHQQITCVVNRRDFQDRTRLLRKHLPRNDIGVVFEMSDDDLVAGLQMLATPGIGHQIDRFGGAAHEDDLFVLRCADESPSRVPGLFVGVGRPGRQLVRRAVDVGVLVSVEVRQPVDHHLRLLGGRGVVEPDQRLPVDRLLQDRKVRPHRGDVEHLVVVGQLRHRIGCGQEVVVGLVSDRRIQRFRPGGDPVRPAKVGNRRRPGQPVQPRIGRRTTRGHRSARRRPGQHTGLRRDDARGGNRERAEVGDAGRQVGIRHTGGGPGGRRRRRCIGHVASRGDRHRLRWGFGFGRRRSRNVDVGDAEQRNRRRVQIGGARRGLSGRGGRRRVRHAATWRDRHRLRRAVGPRPDAGRIQLRGQRRDLCCAYRQVAFGVDRPVLTCTHGTDPRRRHRERPARRRSAQPRTCRG